MPSSVPALGTSIRRTRNGSPSAGVIIRGEARTTAPVYITRQPYGSGDCRVFFGGSALPQYATKYGALAGNAVLTTTWSDTPFAECLSTPPPCSTLNSVAPAVGLIDAVTSGVQITGTNFVAGTTYVYFRQVNGTSQIVLTPDKVNVAGDGSATFDLDLTGARRGHLGCRRCHALLPAGQARQRFATAPWLTPPSRTRMGITTWIRWISAYFRAVITGRTQFPCQAG